MAVFESCVSLGWFCATASSLSKLGLRSFSGPFDWYFSNDYSAVVDLVDTDFKDFLHKDNLVPMEDLQQFEDVKHHFFYLHDNDDREPFEIAYPKIYEKYQRRINTFMEALKSPTCLFRTVSGNEEVDYINQSYEYIDSVFKKYNVNNQVVYIRFKNVKPISVPCIQFVLDLEDRPDREETMRVMFDSSNELLSYCGSLLSVNQKNKNLQYDKETKSYWWIS